MHQVLHIFRKDCRQFWPEILASVVITAMFVWVYPYQWLSPDDPRFLSGHHFLDFRHLQILASTIATLMVLCWFFVTARVVHAENLLGNRQFWITRPYRWQSLLAEKILFVTAFLYLPFAIAQLALLHRAGFSPWHFIPNILYLLALFYGAVGLVFLAFSSVMSSLLRMVLFLLGVSAIIGVVAFFASSGPHDSVSVLVPMEDPFSTPFFLILGLVTVIAVYSGRRIWLGRSLLILFVSYVLLMGASPWDRSVLPYVYPALPYAAAEPLGLRCCTLKSPSAEYSGGKSAYITVPVEVTGIDRNHALYLDNKSLILEGADGTHIELPWQSVGNTRLESEQPSFDVSEELDGGTFGRIRSKPLRIKVLLAITEIAADSSPRTVPYTGTEQLLPDVGICSNEIVRDFNQALNCKFPMHYPSITKLTEVLPYPPCDHAANPTYPARRLTAWIGYWHHDPADFSLTPIQAQVVQLNEEPYKGHAPEDGESCHQGSLEVRQYHVFRRFQLSLTTPTFQFDAPATDKLLPKK